MTSSFIEKTPYDFQNDEVVGLTVRDFHLFEDGKEQAIQSIRWVQDFDAVNVRDNISNHNEISRDNPRGKWITSNAARPLPVPNEWPAWLVNVDHFYVLGYAPPQSLPGSCHSVDVKVLRPDSIVYARSEYCDAEHSSSDPLSGTPFSHQLEGYAKLDETGRIALSLQVTSFYKDSTSALVDVAVEFDSESLSWHWTNRPVKGVATLSAKIGVLGLVYNRNSGTLVTRFSSMGCCPSDIPIFVRGWGAKDPATEFWNIPTAYETQLALPAGEYNLIVVLSDGSKFGRVERPLTIESYDAKQLAISSIMLCRQYRDAAAAEKEQAESHFAPEYLPFVSNGFQYSPTGDTRFKNDDPLLAYFEVFAPVLSSLSSTRIQTRMKITNLTSGKLQVDTGFRNASDWVKPDDRMIHRAQQVDLKKFRKGAYELEVQVTDLETKTTVRRAAHFSIEGGRIFHLS